MSYRQVRWVPISSTRSTTMRWLLLRAVACASLAGALLASGVSAQQGVRREEAQFVAASRGRVYYWIGCDGWKRLGRASLRFFRTSADAEAAGYRPSQASGCAPQLDTALIRPSPGGLADCVVARIIDGDTFQCMGGSRVRLLIADTQETGQGVYADSAAFLLARLMPAGARVRLEFDVGVYDRSRRILAYVYADDVFINRELARRGLALVDVRQPNVKYLDVIRAAVDSARQQQLGVWSGSAFACAPVDYRAGKCR